MTKLRRLVCVASVVALAGAVAPVVYAGGEYPPPPPCDKYDPKCEPPPPPPPPPPDKKAKCNSGNGNGSDAVTFVEGEHCFGGDPGNSFNAGNRGGDEVPPGESNPGGNNVPA